MRPAALSAKQGSTRHDFSHEQHLKKIEPINPDAIQPASSFWWYFPDLSAHGR